MKCVILKILQASSSGRPFYSPSWASQINSGLILHILSSSDCFALSILSSQSSAWSCLSACPMKVWCFMSSQTADSRHRSVCTNLHEGTSIVCTHRPLSLESLSLFGPTKWISWLLCVVFWGFFLSSVTLMRGWTGRRSDWVVLFLLIFWTTSGFNTWSNFVRLSEAPLTHLRVLHHFPFHTTTGSDLSSTLAFLFPWKQLTPSSRSLGVQGLGSPH